MTSVLTPTAHKLTAAIGATVTGIDPGRDLSPETVSWLRSAVTDHKVLVFHDVDLDNAGQQRFAANFGPLTAAHPTIPAEPGAPLVLPVDSEQGRSNHWHTDVTFVVNPPQLSTLRSITVPDYGGETIISNAGAAYRNLPTPLRALADTLWAVHINNYEYEVDLQTLDTAELDRREVFTATRYEAVHPVVRVHPLSGEKGLFIGSFVNRVLGLSGGESRDLIRLLQAYITRPENLVRLSWQPNQLVLFDNRITQHYAVDNYDGLPRRLNRVTVAGDIPAGISGERSYPLFGDSSEYSPTVEIAA